MADDPLTASCRFMITSVICQKYPPGIQRDELVAYVNGIGPVPAWLRHRSKQWMPAWQALVSQDTADEP